MWLPLLFRLLQLLKVLFELLSVKKNAFVIDYQIFSLILRRKCLFNPFHPLTDMKYCVYRLLMVVAAAMIVSMAVANPITVDEAKGNVKKFLTKKGMKKAWGTQALSLAFAISRTDVKEGVEKPVIYAFKMEGENCGFIASADDIAVPVLGYFENGETAFEQMPPNMQAWLNGYADEIAWAREHGYQTSGTIKTIDGKRDIPYMVPTQWDQGDPYYLQCRFNNKYCYAGCLATAMAQVMYYWAVVGRDGETFPHGSAAIEGYISESELYNIPALESVESFAWEDMTTGEPTTTRAKNAVAQLMRYCGQAVRMDYSRFGSGAYSEDVPMALVNYFGYDSGVSFVYRDSVTAAEWDEIVYRELVEGRPVCMGGSNETSSTGHEFVCDGYQVATDKYHFNWGWSGSCDGYFALEALTPRRPGGKPMDYNSYRDLVIGIQPPKGQSGNGDTDVTQVTFVASEDKGVYAGASEYPDQVTKNGITIAVSPKGSFGNGKQYRIYQGSALTVSSTIGNIVKIEIACESENTNKYGPGLLQNPTAGTYSYEGYTGIWSGDTTVISFDSCLSQVRILSLTVFLKDDSIPSQDDSTSTVDNGKKEALFVASEDIGTQSASSFYPDEISKNGITVSVTPTGSFGNGQTYRVYQGSDIVLATDEGNIVKVVVTCTEMGKNKYGPGCFESPSVGSYSYEGNIGTWTGYTNCFSLSAARQVRMTHIDVIVSHVSPKKGDVDIDGRVSFSDVMMTMNYVIGNHPVGFSLENADVNYDGVVNISDVMSIANMVVISQEESE